MVCGISWRESSTHKTDIYKSAMSVEVTRVRLYLRHVVEAVEDVLSGLLGLQPGVCLVLLCLLQTQNQLSFQPSYMTS